MKSRHQGIINLLLVLGIVVAINALASYVHTSLDLTEDKQFTLTEPTIELMENMDNVMYAQLLLAGDLPIEFQRLQDATIDMLEQYKKLSGSSFQYELIDPSQGSVEEVNKLRENLAKDRIIPINLRVVDSDAKTELLVYPYVIFRSGTRIYPANILESEAVAVSPDVQLNNSISLLEYKFSSAIKKITSVNQTNIAFLAGHGEFEKYETIDLENELRLSHNTGRLYLDSVYKIDQQLDLVIVAKPTRPFSDKHKFILDQYLMNGGKILWLIDKLNVNMDSLRQNRLYVPFDHNLNLDDLFFKHGIRVNSDLIQDLESTRIPLAASQQGGQPRYDLFKWYYHILGMPSPGHPISNNLDRVNLKFPSTIDTLKTKYDVKKTVLLTSSEYARFQLTPVQLDLNIVRVPIAPEMFNKPRLPVAVLLEGTFASLYENRISESMESGLAQLGEVFVPKSEETKMMVVSDGDIVYNRLKSSEKEFWPNGYNIYERRMFANKEFILNSIEYLVGGGDILHARTKEIKLRLLNTVKASQEKLKWQLINVAVPIAFLLLFGIIFLFVRRRKYGVNKK